MMSALLTALKYVGSSASKGYIAIRQLARCIHEFALLALHFTGFSDETYLTRRPSPATQLFVYQKPTDLNTVSNPQLLCSREI